MLQLHKIRFGFFQPGHQEWVQCALFVLEGAVLAASSRARSCTSLTSFACFICAGHVPAITCPGLSRGKQCMYMCNRTCSQFPEGACQDIEEDGSGSDFLSEDAGIASGTFLKVFCGYGARDQVVHHASIVPMVCFVSGKPSGCHMISCCRPVRNLTQRGAQFCLHAVGAGVDELTGQS